MVRVLAFVMGVSLGVTVLVHCSSFTASEDATDAGRDDGAPDAELTLDGDTDASGDGSLSNRDATSDAGPGAGQAVRLEDGGYLTGAALTFPSDFTIEARIRPSAFPASEAEIVAQDQSGNAQQQFRFGIDTEGRTFFTMADAAGLDHGLRTGSEYNLVSTKAVPLAAWSHVAVTKKGGDFRLFVDGAAGALAINGFGPASTVALRVGARSTATGDASELFSGDIDEVRVWSIARTAADLQADRTVVEPTADKLFLYFRFDGDGDGGTTAPDLVQGHDLMLRGARFIESDAF